ncbi:MAG TPA: VCBS repeat-containing protein, partial [Gaiellaceae bacterium]|nr:VCBS repeat-containing protein [Gaiellaceae bacterium]
LTLSGTANVQVNTNAASQMINTTTIAGQFIQASGSLTIGTPLGDLSGGVTLSKDFATNQVSVSVDTPQLRLAENASSGLNLSPTGSVSLLILPNGTFAFHIEGAPSLPSTSDVSFVGTLAAEANTTGADQTLGGHLIQAGASSISGSVQLTVTSGFSLNGDFVVERHAGEVMIGGSGIMATVGAGGVAAHVSGGGLVLLLAPDGTYALQAAGAAGLTGITGVDLSGSLALERNSSATHVTRTLTIGGAGHALDVAGNLTRVHGAGIALTVFGQSLSGDFTIADAGSGNLDIAIANGAASLGGGLVTATGVNSTVHLTPGTLDASLDATGSITVPGLVAASGPVVVSLHKDGTPANDKFAVAFGNASTDATLAIAGQSITGKFSYKQNAPGDVTVGASNVGLSFGTYVVITGASGAFDITSAGAAGSIAVTNALINVPGLITTTSPGIGATIEVNTRPTGAAGLPAGPFLRVELDVTTPLVVGGLGKLAGTFLFQQEGTTTIFALTGATAYLGTSSTAALTQGEGAFLITSAGIAGYLSGKAAAAAGDVAIGGSVLLRVNTTNGAVDQVVTIGGQDLRIHFGEAEGSTFTISVTSLSINIADVAYVEGSVNYSTQDVTGQAGAQTFAGSGLTVFFGNGPLTLANGDRNPLAQGILLTNATIGLIKVAGVGFALDAIGTAETVGFGQTSVSGTVHVRVNSFNHGFNDNLAIAGTDASVTVLFSGSETGGSSPFAAVTGTGVEVKTFGQALNGDVTITKNPTSLSVALSNVDLALSDQNSNVSARGPPFLHLSQGSGSLTISSAGVVASISGRVQVTLPGVSLDATLALAIDTTAATPSFHLSGNSVNLTVLGQTLSGTFTFDRVNASDGSTTTTITATAVTLSLAASDGGPAVISVDQGTGSLTISSAGLVGSLSAHVTTAPGSFSLGANISIAVDTTAASPTIHIEADGATVTAGTQTLTGNFAFDRVSDSTGAGIIRVAVSNVAFSLGNGAVGITNGHGNLFLTGGGVAGQLSGDAAVSIPGVTFTGSLSLQFNTLGTGVDQVFRVNGVDTTLTLPLGPYIQLSATGAALDVLGQHLSGDFTFTKSGADSTLTVANGALSLAGGLISATSVTGSVTVNAAGVSSSTLSGSLSVSLPAVQFTGGVTIALDTRTGSRSVSITGTTLLLTIGGASASGSFTFQQATDAAGATVVTAAASSVGLTFGSFVTITGASGQLVIGATGLAAHIDAPSIAFAVPGFLSTTLGGSIELNTSPSAINETVGGTTLSLPAGPFLRVTLTVSDSAPLTIGTVGSLSGTFFFEQQSGTTVIAMTNVVARIGADTTSSAVLSNGEGAFVVTGGNIAGFVSGHASVPGLAGNVLLRVNQTGGAVSQTVDLNGRSIAINFDAADGNVFALSVTDLSLNIGDFVTVEGSIAFSNGSFAGDNLSIFLGRGPAKLADGSINPLAQGVLLSNARIGVVQAGSGYALFATGTVSLIGINGVTITGTATVRVNNTGGDVNQTLSIPGASDVIVNVANGVHSFQATGATLALAGQTLTGDFTFDQTAAGEVTVAAANVSLSLGSLSITNGSGALIAGGSGIAGTISGTVALVIPGVTVGGTISVSLNTQTAAVSRTFTVGTSTVVLNLPAGPYVRAEGVGLSLNILGQTLAGDFSFERVTLADSSTATAIAASNVTFSLGAGSNGISLTNGHGALLVLANGLAGELDGTIALTLPAGVAFTGTFSLLVNNTGAAVHQTVTVAGDHIALDLPGGPYLRFSGAGVSLDVAGQHLSGDFSFEQAVDLGADGVPGSGTPPVAANADTNIIRIAAANVSLQLGPLSVTGGSGVVLLSATGVAGELQGTIGLSVPGVSVGGVFKVQFNTGAQVDTTYQFGGAALQLHVPGNTVQVSGTGVDVNVFGQSLHGNVTITRNAAGSIDVAASGIVVKLGGSAATPILTATQTAGTATFTISSTGITGSIGATLALTVPGVSLGGTFTLTVDSAHSLFRLAGTSGVHLDVFGQSLTGDFTIERAGDVLRLGVANGGLSLAGGVLTVSHATGLFVITSAGVAGSLAATVGVNTATTGLALNGSFELALNTTGAAVTESLLVGSTLVTVDVPAGPYLRLSGTGVSVVIGGQRLTGDFTFQQVTLDSGLDGIPGNADDTKAVQIGVANVTFSLGDGTTNFLSLTSGSGTFVLLTGTPTGVAGHLTATAAIQNVPDVSFSGTLTLDINTTGVPVSATVVVGGFPQTLSEPLGPFVRVSGKSLSLTVAGQTLSGDITFERTGDTTPVVTVRIANGEIGIGDGTTTLVRASDINGSITLVHTGIYGEFNAAVAIDIPNVSFSGRLHVQLNTTDGQLDGIDPGFLIESDPLAATPVTLTIAGLTLGGSFTIRKTNSDLSIAVTNLAFDLSDGQSTPFVHVTGGTGAMLITSAGIAASLTLTGVTITLPGVVASGGTFTFEVNTGGAAVNRSFDVGLGTATVNVPAGPFIRVKVAGATVTLGGSFSIGGAGSLFYFDQSQRSGFSVTDPTAFTGSVSGTSVVAGDLNKDGALDVVVGTSASGAKIYMNNGSGVFSTITAGLFSPDATANVSGLALVDGNHDGWLDLVVAENGAASKVYVNQGDTRSGTDGTTDGTKTFTTPTGTFASADVGRTITLSGASFTIASVTNATTVVLDRNAAPHGAVSWQIVAWLGFAAGTALGSSAATTAVATGDVNNDGLDDVILSTATTATLFVNQGLDSTSGAWLGFASGSALPQTLPASAAIAIADLNGDGLGDLVVGGSSTKLYLNQGAVRSGADGATTANSTTFTSATAAFTQADKGRTILIGTTFFTIGTVTDGSNVVVNANVATTAQSALTWSLTLLDNGTVLTSSSATSLAVGDLNGDGLPDLVVGGAGGATQLLNSGPDNTGVWQPFAAGVSLSTASVKSVAIGDVDGDGTKDVVLGIQAQNQLLANRGGSGTGWLGLKAGIGFGTTSTVTAIALGNVDTDRDLDLVAVNTTGAPSLYRAGQVTVTRLAATGVTATLNASGVGVDHGQGAFVITADGIAGNFSGQVDANIGGFNAGVSVSARINTTGKAVDETIVIGGTPLDIKFSAAESATNPFVEVSGSGSIRIGNFIELEGSFTASQTSFNATANVFIGQGPSHLSNGSINPSARGLYLTGATVEFIQASGKYIVWASGNISLIGIPGVTLSGAVTVQFNNSGAAGSSGTHTVAKDARSVEGSDIAISLGGVDFGGDVSFDDPGDGTVAVTFNNVHVDLGNGAVSVTNLAGAFSFSSAGIVGQTTSGSISVHVPGFPSADATLQINTTAATAMSIAAHTLKVQAALNFTFAGQVLAGTFAFEQVDGQVSPSAPAGTKPPKLVRVGASGVHIFIGDSANNAGLDVTNGTGFFLITAGGIAGSINADVAFHVPGGSVDFGGSFQIALNTTTSAVSQQFQVGGQSLNINAPAGPYLRIAGTGVHLTILGQTITGDFTFEQATDGGNPVTRILAENVTASFGDASNTFVSLADGSGFFVIRGGAGGGIAGRIAGNVAISVPGVQVSGAFTLAFSNIGTPVTAQIAFGDQPAQSTTVAVGDLNGDQKADLIVATNADGIFLYLNDGSGSPFDTIPAIHIDTAATAGDNVKAIALGDVDGNGSLDLVVAAATNRVYLNNGHGVFTLDSHSLGTNGTAVAIGDVNGDGRGDIAVGHNGADVQLYISGALSTSMSGGVTTTTWAGPGAATLLGGDAASNTTSLVFADIDKDGHPDLVVGNKGQANHLYMNTGTALGSVTSIGSETDNTVALAVGDVDGDGYVDVVAINAGQSKAYLNRAVGSSVTWASPVNVGDSLAAATSGVLVDVNADGNLDLVVGVSGGPNRVYLNNGSTSRTAGNGFTTNASNQFKLPTGQITSADFGLPIEIVGVRYRIVGPITAGTGPDAAFSFVTLDRNVTADQTNTVWRIRTWSGVGSATTAFTGDTTHTNALATGDLNGDGKADLVVVNGGAAELNGVYFGDGSTFASPTGVGIVSFSVGVGPFLRVEGAGVDLTVLGQNLHGDIQFEQSGTGSARTTSVTILSGATLTFEGLDPLNVDGSLLITAAGVAGRFHLSTTTTSFVIGPVTLNGALDLSINTTGNAVTLADATRLDAGPFLRIEGTTVSVTLGDASVSGSFSIEQSTNNLGQRRLAIGVTGATVAVGATTLLSHGTGALLILSDGMAGKLSGTFSTAGLLPASIGIVGTFGIAINRTNHAVNETVTVAGQAVTLDLPAGPYVQLTGDGVQISILGQTLSGNFSIEKTATTTTLKADNVALHIGSGGTDFVTLTGGHGSLVVSGSGLQGTIAGTVAVNVPGVHLAGTLQLEIDTTLPLAQQYVRVKGTGVSVTVLNQTLTGNFAFSQTGTGATKVITLHADNVGLTLGTATLGLTLSGGNGDLTITSGGVFGSIGGSVSAALPGFAASFTVSVEVNTTTGDHSGIPAGSLRVSADALTLTFLGTQTLTGNFLFEQVKDAGPDGLFNTGDDTKVIKVGVTNLGLTLGTATAGVTISGGTALLVITSAGLAAQFGATATINLGPSVAATATVTASINNTNAAVNEKFVVGGVTQTLALPIGPYLKIAVTGLSVTIAGQTLTGDFSFTKTATESTVDLANVGLRLGSATHDFVVVSNGSGHFTLLTNGITGTVTATVAVDIPNVTVGGTFSVTIDTTTGSPDLTVTATNAYVGVLGQKLTVDSFTFHKAAGLVTITVHNAKLALGDGNTTFVLVTLTDGSLTLKGTGVIASLTGTITTPGFTSDEFSLTTSVSLDIDTTTSTPYLRVTVGPTDLTILGQTLHGTFTFEQLTTSAGAKVVRIGLTEVHLFIGATGGPNVTIDHGNGSILITPVGFAGSFSGTPSINLPPFSITATVSVEINRLSSAFKATFSTPSGPQTIDLQAGPYLRVAAYGIDLSISGYSAIHGDFFFEQATHPKAGGGTESVTKVGAANISFNGGAGVGAIQNARGALVLTSAGLAGVVLGSATAAGSGFSIGGTVGLGINTTSVHVTDSVTVNGVVIPIDVDPGVAFIIQNADFNFLNLLEIHGNFSIQSNGSFKATGLEIFVGKGPYRIDGNPNPDAIGLLLTNAAVSFQRAGTDNTAGTYTLYAKGTLALVGLDGLQVSGTVELKVNTTATSKTIPDPNSTTGQTITIPGNGFDVAGDIHFTVPGVLDISGAIHVTRQSTGVLNVSIGNATIAVTVSGQPVFSISGAAAFEIGGEGGFHLSSFKVNGFSIFGQSLGSTTGTPPLLAPLASLKLDANSLGLTDPTTGIDKSLTDELAGNVIGPKALSVLNTRHYVDVDFTDQNGAGMKDSTILDATPEFEFLVNGSAAAGVTINGTPTKVAGTANTYRYTFTGNLPTSGVFGIHFLPGSFSDNTGSGATGVNSADTTQQSFIVQAEGGKPGPTASLASPGDGDSLTAQALNAKHYIDVTFETHDGSVVDKTTIENHPAPFKLSGTGIGDLAVDVNGVPILIGSPLLLRGSEPDAKKVTYRFFLKDKDTTNTLDVFQPGMVTVTFAAGAFKANNVNSTATKATFTLDPNAPGAATGNGTITLGPLSLQGPSLALADIGFQDGKLILSIAIGLDHAGLNFGGTAAASSQTTSGISLNLTGILGTFDLSVDALGILGGHFSASLPGKFSLRVASLDGHVPDVVDINASGIVVHYDPAGPADQELVRIDSASITFPKLNVRGTIRPYDTNAGHNVDSSTGGGSNIIPGLVVRSNGFTLGTAELQYGGIPNGSGNQLTPQSGDGKIHLGNVVVFDDLRIGVNNFSVNFDAANPVVFNGSIYFASGGAKFFPDKAYNATITDRNTADDKNADGTPNTEAFRLQLTFANGRVQSFQAKIDTLTIHLGSFLEISARDFMLNTGAADNEELVSFQSVGAHITAGGLDITGEARSFAFLGDGTFVTKPGFGVFLGVGSASGSSFGIPDILGVHIDALGIEWADIQHHPEDFVLTVSASVTGIKGIDGLEFSGAIQGLRIQPSLLAQGKFPIISIDSLAVGVKGDLFGGQLDAQLLGGILKLDSNYNIIGTFDTTTPVAQRVFYLGIQGGFTMMGMGGFTIRLGLSELGPLSVFINVKTPTGVMIVPQIGLVLNDFSAGVEFFKTLPSIEDPFALRNPEFGLPTDQTADQWLAGLQQQVAAQALAIHNNP